MSLIAVLGPVFVQVALTFALLIWSGTLRIRAVRTGVVHSRDIALRQSNWPPRVTQISNAFQNQLELPVLFYVVVVLALFTAHATPLIVGLAWAFVLCRLLHALIHVTTNNVARRFFAYFAGLAVLIVMWLVLLYEIVAGP